MIGSIFNKSMGLLGDIVSPYFDSTLLSLSELYEHNFYITSLVSVVYWAVLVIAIGEWLIVYINNKKTTKYLRLGYIYVAIASSCIVHKFSLEFILLVGTLISIVTDFIAGLIVARQTKSHPVIAILVIAISGAMFYLTKNYSLPYSEVILPFFKIGFIALIAGCLWDQLNGLMKSKKEKNKFAIVVFVLVAVFSLVIRMDGIGTNIGSIFFIGFMRFLIIYIKPFSYVVAVLLGLILEWGDTLPIKSFKLKKYILPMIASIMVLFLSLSYTAVSAQSLANTDIRRSFPVIFNPDFNAEAGSIGKFTGRILGSAYVSDDRVHEYNACLDTGFEYIPIRLKEPKSFLGRKAVLTVKFTGKSRNFEIISVNVL